MSLAQFPRQFLVDNNGVPRIGAEAYFYLPTTSTPITTYTTPAYAVEHAHPVESEGSGTSYGLFPAVYINPATNPTYKVVIKDSAGNTIYTEDNIPAALNTAADVGAAIYFRSDAEIAAGVTPTDYRFPWGALERYGCVGNGTADDSSAHQLAVNSGHKYVFGDPTKTYYIREVSVTSANAGLRIDYRGAGVKTVPGKVGSYHAALVINSSSNIIIENGVFDGNSSAQSADAPNVDRYAAIYAISTDGLTIRNNRFSNTYGNAHVRVQDGSYVSHHDNYHDGTTSPGAGTDLQPGFYYTTSGTRDNYDVSAVNNRCNHSSIALTDSPASQRLFNAVVDGNTIVQGTTLNSSCIGVRASNVSISGNSLYGGYFGMTLSVGVGERQQNNITVTGNTIVNPAAAYSGYGIEHYAYGVTITGNTLVDCGITTSNPTGDGVTISGNTFLTTKATAYTDFAISIGGSGTHTNVNIIGNTMKGHGTFVGWSTLVTNCNITGNVAMMSNFSGTSQFLAYVNNSGATKTVTGLVVANNTIGNAQRGFFYFNGNSGAIVVDGARVIGNVIDSNSFGGNVSFNATFPNQIYRDNENSGNSVTLAYSASMTPDAAYADRIVITATNGSAFTINAPTNACRKNLTFTIRNTSGGALGSVTWNAAFKLASWTSPGTGNNRSITFAYDGTNWIEISRIGTDVPN